ncbi:hypothetical protein AAG906_019671 [Vitis piasezkii]
MPLCRSKVEQVTTEDLVELSEIEKHKLGQSLLSFSGNKNVHALYDFMLNYRSFLTSLTSVDVPLLYSPVPFQNAALSAPEPTPKQQAATGEAIQESTYAFGIPEAVVTCYMHSAFLKRLKYANASFTARLWPV